MNKTTESLAIKALEMIAGERMCINNLLSDKDIAREALAAIREALAEQEKQEPVAWPVDRNWFYSVLRYAEKNPDCFDEVAPDCVSLDSCDADTVIDALNAAPVSAKREWVELPDYEIVMLYAESPMCDSEMIQFARAVIAKFKEKQL